MGSEVNLNSVSFHFDVMCPWAYQTSIWMREVRDRLDLEVDWCFFSLEEINRTEGKKHPWEREWSYGWSMMRIGAFLKRIDPALNDAWYFKSGTALHMEGRKPHDPEVARLLLTEMDQDPSVVDEALSDSTTHDDVKRDHEIVTSLGGNKKIMTSKGNFSLCRLHTISSQNHMARVTLLYGLLAEIHLHLQKPGHLE